MSATGVTIIITALIFVVVMAKISILKRKPPKENEMRQGMLFMCGSWLSFVIGWAPIVSYFTSPSSDILVGIFFITPFGFWAFLALFSSKYVYGDTYFEETSWVTPSKVYFWRDLVGVRRGSQSVGNGRRFSGLLLEFSDKEVLVPKDVENLDAFTDFLRAKNIDVASKN